MSRVASTWSPATQYEAAQYEVQLSLRLSQADAATRREHYRRLAVREQARAGGSFTVSKPTAGERGGST